MTDATEKLVDDILRIGQDSADPAPEPVRAARIYHKTCVLCGADFAAKSPAALYCPDCVRKRRIDGGRKSAEKAREAQAEKDGPPRASAPTEPPEGKQWVKIPLGRPLSDFFTAEDIYSRKAGIAGPLRDEVEVVVALEEQICAEHGLTFGQLAEAFAALRHYKAVLERLGSENKEDNNES